MLTRISQQDCRLYSIGDEGWPKEYPRVEIPDALVERYKRVMAEVAEIEALLVQYDNELYTLDNPE